MTTGKQTLRKELLQRRQAVTPEEQHRCSAAVCEHFIHSAYLHDVTLLAGYVARHGEIDPLPILEHAAETGITTALPVTEARNPMHFIRWQPDGTLREGRYGIPEPAGEEAVTPGLILVPLLAFDATGHRLGFGKGYYDRALSGPALADSLRIGLAYSWQQVEHLPAEPHDVRLHAVITENTIIDFL